MNKIDVHKQCLLVLEERISFFQKVIDEARKSAASDTKSSAGDKHETGRAMAQLEQEKNAVQLAEVNKLFVFVGNINPTYEHTKIAVGSLISTSIGDFSLSVGLGKIIVSDQDIFVISSASPIGEVLLSKEKGDIFTFNGEEVTVGKVT